MLIPALLFFGILLQFGLHLDYVDDEINLSILGHLLSGWRKRCSVHGEKSPRLDSPSPFYM